MKKILLLGGSAQQLVAINAAKNLGYYTILCDYLPDNPGQHIADKYYNTSTTDVEAIYEIAKTEAINGILAYASDPAALPAAIVAERLNLPTNPVKSIEILGVKHPWRKFLSDNGFACPKYFNFHSSSPIEDIKKSTTDFNFPLIVKPTDSSGSKGVTLLQEWDALDQAINSAKQFSRNNILLIEEYIQRGFPAVIGGDIFVWNGEIVLYGEMECIRDNVKSPLIPIGKKMPPQITDFQRSQIHTELQKVISALNIRFGELNIEIILDNNDNVHFLELGPRAGGNMIPIQLGDVFGIDLVEANVKAAMGVPPEFIGKTLNQRPGCFMHYVLHSYNSGKFNGIDIDKSLLQNIYRQVLYKQKGDNIEIFDGAGKAIGIIFLHFDSIAEMEQFCKHKDELIKLKLKQLQ